MRTIDTKFKVTCFGCMREIASWSKDRITEYNKLQNNFESVTTVYNHHCFISIVSFAGGLSTTAMVKIQLTDVNDNKPVFYPREYNVSLRDGGASSSVTSPVVVVAATDPDSGRYGAVTYRIVAGNEVGLFR